MLTRFVTRNVVYHASVKVGTFKNISAKVVNYC